MSTTWAQQNAAQIVARFSDAASIDTANYGLCGFIIAAAQLALEDEAVAERIGKLMEPPRDRA